MIIDRTHAADLHSLADRPGTKVKLQSDTDCSLKIKTAGIRAGRSF
jgi:hypothetical protein